MGTALESTTDQDDKNDIQQMVDAVKSDGDPRRNRALQLALRKAINAVIFEGQEIAPVRNTVTNAIAMKVKASVLEEYNKWVKDGKKPDKWPFKDDPNANG